MKRLGVALIVVLALVGAAIVGVMSAKPSRAANDYPLPLTRDFVRLMPPYPNASYRAAGESLHVDNANRVMAYAETDDAPADVLKRYLVLFEQRSLRVRVFKDGLVATAIDDDWKRSVVVSAAGAKTMIVASVSREQPTLDEARLPMPRNCKLTDSAGSRDGAIVRENIQVTCDAFVDDVLGYYDALMGQPARMDETHEATHIRVYERDNEHLTLVAVQLTREPPVVALTAQWEAQ